jgi:hypothetical protein
VTPLSDEQLWHNTRCLAATSGLVFLPQPLVDLGDRLGCSLRASGANRKPVLLLHSGRVHPKPFSSKFTPSPRKINAPILTRPRRVVIESLWTELSLWFAMAGKAQGGTLCKLGTQP